MKTCFYCGSEVKLIGTAERNDVCVKCGSDLRVCCNCLFYDESLYNACKEPLAERVSDREKANFCEYFEFKDSAGSIRTHEKDDALKKLNALFRGA